ncbi:hypothetical protein LCGC14_0662770 [marine sediment metagenome]|uniref:Uncharacterized protein n=1 Tax=marine sediment metagenome TaxID=412755 RepID=A0A0F9RD64_9ZZZZ
MQQLSDLCRRIADVLEVVPGVASAEPLPPDTLEGLELPHFYVLYEGLTPETRPGSIKMVHSFRLRLILAQGQSLRWAMENGMSMILPTIRTLQKGDNLQLGGLATNTEIAEVLPIPAEWMLRTGYLGFDFIYQVYVTEDFDFDG